MGGGMEGGMGSSPGGSSRGSLGGSMGGSMGGSPRGSPSAKDAKVLSYSPLLGTPKRMDKTKLSSADVEQLRYARRGGADEGGTVC